MLRRISALIAILLFAIMVQADPVGCLIKSSGTAGDFPGAGKLIIFDSTFSDVQETGLTYVYTHRLYKVLTSRGALDLSTITYGYDPLSAYVEIQKVLIHRKSGEVESLDIESVKDYPAPARAIYWGASEKMIEVGRLEPGDAVEVFLFRKGFTYALLAGDDDDMYIPPMRGHFYDIIEGWSPAMPWRYFCLEKALPTPCWPVMTMTCTSHLCVVIFMISLNSGATILFLKKFIKCLSLKISSFNTKPIMVS